MNDDASQLCQAGGQKRLVVAGLLLRGPSQSTNFVRSFEVVNRFVRDSRIPRG